MDQFSMKILAEMEVKMLTKLDQILKKLDEVEKQLAAQDQNTTQNRDLDALVSSVRESILHRIQKNWEEKKPTECRHLAQLFGRKTQPVGGVDTILRILLDEEKIEEHTKFTGARMFLPKGALDNFTHEAIDAIRSYGMSLGDIRRHKEREQEKILQLVNSAELTEEELADIDRQNAEFAAKLKAEGAI